MAIADTSVRYLQRWCVMGRLVVLSFALVTILSVSVTLLFSVAASDQAQPAAEGPGVPQALEVPAVIKPGLSVGGVAVGGMSVDEAVLTLKPQLRGPLMRAVTVKGGKKRFRLSMNRIGLRVNAEKSATRALKFGETLEGEIAQVDILPTVTFKRAAVTAFVADVARSVSRAPVDARVKLEADRMVRSYSKPGRALKARKLKKGIIATLEDPTADRVLRAPIRRLEAKVKYKDLANTGQTAITIDRGNYLLRLFQNLKLIKTYSIGVGQPSYPTPVGSFHIQNKQVNPTWYVPNSAWAGSLAGTRIPGGAPNNPLRARWLGVSGPIGIHGTNTPGSLGVQSSHGCIRMAVPDVIELYGQVSVGTPVLIK